MDLSKMEHDSIRNYDNDDLTDITDRLEKQEASSWPRLGDVRSLASKPRPTAYLDGLRGVAALMVYMSHHVPWFYGFDNAENSLERGYGDGARDLAMLPFIRLFFTGGSAAVAIFFVLSGYVLSRGPLNLLRAGQTNKYYAGLMSATIRRPIRLFLPPAAVSLAFALTMQLPWGLAPRMTWPEPQKNLGAQLANWADEFWRIINIFERHGINTRWFPYSPPLWTIAIEFRGSLVLFALLAWYGRVSVRARSFLFVIIGCIFLFLYEWSLACFMAGVVLAINDLEGIDIPTAKQYPKRIHKIFQVTIFMLGWWFIGQPGGKREPERALRAPGWYYLTIMTPNVYYQQEYWRFWHAVGSMLLVYGVLKIHILQRLLNTRYITYLGKVSFALYLTHIPFLWTIGDRIYRIFGTSRMDFKTGLDNLLYIPDVGPRGISTRFLISQAFILSLNLLLAQFITIWVDGPSIKVGRWISSKLVPQTKSGFQA